MSNKSIQMLIDGMRNIHFKRDAAIAQNDIAQVVELNKQLDKIEERLEAEKFENSAFKSSRFTRPKTRNVSQRNPSMGYAKPIQQQQVSNKYHCIVSGEKRMEPCGGCSNPKGCLSSSMQYKEQSS